ncbi:MAG: thiamine phosphate synthase [Anaerolineae bacterium]
MQDVDWSVYVITGPLTAPDRSVVDVVRAAIRGGATVVQLREKEATTRDMIELGRALLAVTRPAGVPLIVNDRLDVALAIEAEGLHVGMDDMPVATARRLLGPDLLLGYSPNSVAAARQGAREGADYLGIGDVFGTGSKPDAGEPVGLEGLTAAARAVSIPVVAIGGVTVDNTPAAIEAGAAGVAVISAVMGAKDPETAARRLRQAVAVGRHAVRAAQEVQE